jgi:centromere protein B
MATSKRKNLTIAEKVKIIQEVGNNPSTPTIEIARKFNLALPSLFCVMKNKQLILDEEVKCGGEAIKRINIKSSPYDEMEKILIEWFEGMRSANLPINGVLLKEKAIRVAIRLRIENFKGSSGWLDRFKKRHGLEYKSLCGESASVDDGT